MITSLFLRFPIRSVEEFLNERLGCSLSKQVKCPHSGRRGWSHAREHGDLSEDRGGAGDEVTRSAFEGHHGEDQVVAGGGVDWHQPTADRKSTRLNSSHLG